LTENISAALPNGSIIKIEVSNFGREEVSFKEFSFDEISDALCGITAALKGTIEKAKPKKASIKFGLEVGVESGSLTAIIVKGSGKANLEITLEWEE
jgi:hypothetical protein